MATFYHGYRHVLRGRNGNDNVNPYNGRKEEYSNYSIFNPSQILDGAPNENHVPGTGRHPHGLHMSRIYRGLENGIQPIKNVGGGARLEGFRYRPLENKAAGNNLVFKSGYGHKVGTPVKGQEQYGHVDWIYDGVTKKPLSGTFGHKVREVDAPGTANSFGTFQTNNPAFYKVGPDPMEDPGNSQTFDQTDNSLAHQEVNEWKGVPSAKAIKI